VSSTISKAEKDAALKAAAKRWLETKYTEDEFHVSIMDSMAMVAEKRRTEDIMKVFG
jgi:hypothetical protein